MSKVTYNEPAANSVLSTCSRGRSLMEGAVQNGVLGSLNEDHREEIVMV